MTIDKAIEILNSLLHAKGSMNFSYTEDAIKLGDEALKRIREQRKDPECRGFYILPGETKD